MSESGSGGTPAAAPALEAFKRALDTALFAHGDWVKYRHEGEARAEDLATAAYAAENAVVALYAGALSGVAPEPNDAPVWCLEHRRIIRDGVCPLCAVAPEPSEAAIETLREFITSTLEGSAARKESAREALDVLTGAAGRGSAPKEKP